MSLLRSFFGGQKTTTGAASALDVVTYVASLASSPKAIDPLLDPMREITSRLQPGQTLSVSDQTTLVKVCQQIQEYLVTQDPLRSFDKVTLDKKIRQKFPNPSPKDAAFWTALQKS